MKEDYEIIKKHPLVRALLDWVEGHVLILDDDRRIVAVSGRLPDHVRQADAEGLLGQRPGAVLNCAHAGEGRCSEGVACKFCGALEAFNRSRTERDVEAEYKLITSTPAGDTSYKFDVKASRFPLEGREYTALFLRKATELSRSSRFRAVVGDRDWPEDLTGFHRVRLLGIGGMGSVYLVKDDNGEEFALKTLNEDLLGDSERVERFRRELEISLKLDHPNIIRTFQAGHGKDGIVYMICEYCPLGSAFRHLKFHGALPLDLALFWMIGAARGLDYLWREHGVIHRDLKPDNLLVARDYQVKISDFGIARPVERRARLTAPDTILGSPEYMSPEQIRGEEDLDVRSDLYALGTTFYELLLGKSPFEAVSAMGSAARHMQLTPKPLVELRPDVPDILSRTLERLLEKKREDRPETPADILPDLLEAARELGVDSENAPQTTKSVETKELDPLKAKTKSPENPT